MGAAEAEQVTFVLKVLEQEKTEAALKSARASAAAMTDQQKSAALAAADAARRQVAAQQAVEQAQRTAAEQSRRLAEIQRTESAKIMERIEGMRAAYQAMRTVFQGALTAARALGEYSSDLSREYSQLESATEGFMRALADGSARGSGFTQFIDGLTESFRDLIPWVRDAATEVSDFLADVRDVVGAVTGGRLGNANWHEDWWSRRGHGRLSPVTGDYDTGWGELGEYARLPQSIPSQENLDWTQGGILATGQSTLPGDQQWLGNQRTPRSRAQSGGGGGGGGLSPSDFAEYGPSQEEFYEAIRRESQAWSTLNSRRREEEEEVARVRMSAAEAQAQAIQDQKALEEEAHQQRLEFAESEKDIQKQLRDYTREQIIGSITAFSNLAQVGSNIFSQLATRQEQQIAQITSVLKASGASQDAIERATKAQTERLDRLKKAEGGFLIAYNTVMAATSIAQAAGAYGEMRYDAMASFITAAAGYAAAAVMAGIRLGDDGSGGGGAAAPAASAPSFSPQASRPSSGENTSTNVTVFTWGYSNSGLGRQVERARWEYERSGGDGDMLPEGGYDQ